MLSQLENQWTESIYVYKDIYNNTLLLVSDTLNTINPIQMYYKIQNSEGIRYCKEKDFEMFVGTIDRNGTVNMQFLLDLNSY